VTDISASSSASARIATSPFLMALIAVLIASTGDIVRGYQVLSSTLDNDSQMRLVEVRDLLAGQGWFDLHQYRLGAPEGSSMHWSRLVDAPIAAIVWLGAILTGSQSIGETIALVLWPALTFVAALYFILRAARRYAGEAAMFPAAVIGAISLNVIGIFGAGSLDHHNVQLALTMAILAFLLESLDRPRVACFAGVAAALTLAIGMETAPYVAFAGMAVGVWYLLRGEEASLATINFGLGFAGAALFALFLAKPPSAWLGAECDAYSAFQFAIAFAGGIGIAIVAGVSSLRTSLPRRGVSLISLGIVLVALILLVFPQCVAAPYSDMDPRLREYWMDSITEAQPIWSIFRAMPIVAANAYPTVIVAIVWLVWRMLRKGVRVQDALVAAFLIPAAAVSFYQLRGANFALAFAVTPLAAMVAHQRELLEKAPSLKTNLRAVAAWLVSVNLVWMLATTFVVDKISPGQSEREKDAIGGANSCSRGDDFAKLAAMPAARVVSITNLGAPILRYTAHHSFAGPYHRNVAGNLVALNLLSAKPEAAQAIAETNGVELVVVCRGNPESENYSSGTLQAELNAERPPAWLILEPETAGANLEVYRVVRK
jgi:hypothetical protein